MLIRTEEMHRCAEYGIAADFRYPHARRPAAPRRGADQLDLAAPGARLGAGRAPTRRSSSQSLRCDLAEGQIQVFADGRPFVLPAGATPVDLAYELGTEQGDRLPRRDGSTAGSPRCRSPLDDGDVVEIFTETDGDDEFEADVAPARPPPGVARASSSRRTRRCRSTAGSPSTPSPGITIADKVRLGPGHDRADPAPARPRPGQRRCRCCALAEELGYPDLETLLVAVFDRAIEPDTVVDQLIALVDHRQ